MDWEELKQKYEKQRKLREYKKDRLKEVFPDISMMLYSILPVSLKKEPTTLEIKIDIEWNKNKLRTAHWSSLVKELSDVYTSWPDFQFSFETKELQRPKIGYKISFKGKPSHYEGKFWKKKTISEILKRYGLFNSIKSLHFADYMKISVVADDKEIFTQAFHSKDEEGYDGRSKLPCRDSIVLEDMPLVANYYRIVEPFILEDLKDRGLTVTCAVKDGEGESIVRRNAEGKRLVVSKLGDLTRIVENYFAYEFIPDLNLLNSDKPNKIVWDVDPSPYVAYPKFRDFVNEFRGWLAEHGIQTKMRRTGGKGVHIIADIDYDSIPSSYEPFGRQLKFDTKRSRIGEKGFLWESLQDFIKISCIGFCYEKKRRGSGFPLTLERDDISQRLWNIYVDWSVGIKDRGVRSLGSIHKKTGNICMPLEFMPASRLQTFEGKFKEISLVASRPTLLYENPIPKSSFSAVEEIFHKYSWMPILYYKLGPEKFYAKYVWP